MAPIHTYASKGDNQNLENELKELVDIDLPSEITRETPLHRAALAGHADTVKLLLERGADIYKLSKYGNNALHYAVQGSVNAQDSIEKQAYYNIFEHLLLAEAELREQENKTELPKMRLKETVNTLKVTPVSRLKNYPDIQKVLKDYIAKYENTLNFAEKEVAPQNQAPVKQPKSVKTLETSSLNSSFPIKGGFTSSLLSMFGTFANSIANDSPQRQEATQSLLDKKTR